MIRGIASTFSPDGHGTCLWPHGLTINATPLPLLHNHAGDPIGDVVHVEAFTDMVVATGLVRDQHLFEKIGAGTITQMSVGFADDSAYGRNITRWRLREVSITEAGSNADTFVGIYRPPVRLIDRNSSVPRHQ